MDGWQAVQSWSIFGVAVGLACFYYYTPKSKQAPKLVPLKEGKKEVKSEVKKTSRNIESAAKKQAPKVSSAETPKSESSSKGNGRNKRKGIPQPNPTTTPAAATAEPQDDNDALDMSTRQFAANMKRAREGVDMKKSDSKETRVKTIKTKAMDSPILSTGSSSNEDADSHWTQVTSPALRSSGVDDMLEPRASGPSALRITAPTKPVKEKVNKPAKEVVVETKKQRQNRKKKEDERLAREAAESVRKVQQEQQRRTAREGRGEAARNGIPIPAAPARNPWSEQNAVRDVQLPVKAGDSVQLLDTFDAESTSSSNGDKISTAATSTADGPAEEDGYAKAVAESERETGWNEVKSTKKPKKSSQSETTSKAAPVAAPMANPAARAKTASNGKPVGFQALQNEYEHRTMVADPSDADNWAA